MIKTISQHPKDSKHCALFSHGIWFSPCFWSPPGEASEDGYWCWVQDEGSWIAEIKNPSHFTYLEVPNDSS